MMTITGEVRGLKFRKFNDFEFRSLVVEDENMENHDISLGRDQEGDQFLAQLEKLKGKVCEIPFYIRRYKTKSGDSQVSLNYVGSQLPKMANA